MTECTRSATQPQQHPAPASFLDGICDFDDDDDTVTAPASELDLFFAAFRTHGRGSRDTPLLWWKVLFSFLSVSLFPGSLYTAIPGSLGICWAADSKDSDGFRWHQLIRPD
jgi:hypothetical protein